MCKTIQRSIGLFNNWIRTSHYARRKKYFHHSYTKKHFEELFEVDFHKSVRKYNKEFKKKYHTKKDKELLIEMIYQLGSQGVLKFKNAFLFK